jgi:putative phosphoribosyl transferase
MIAAGQESTADGAEVCIDAGPVQVAGTLGMPLAPRGLVLFAHGSGSGRFSPRNREVAGILRKDGFATLLVDLLTPEEESRDQITMSLRFDIALLAQRVVAIIDALARDTRTRDLRLAIYGASTGASAALVAAATRPHRVHAIVSRGGRPDLAADSLSRVVAPTLLIVGSEDQTIADLNQAALGRLRGPHRLAIVPGATHLFEEPGALERVAELTRAWVRLHLAEEWKATVAAGR